jgi:Protein of unknown function (DUF2934)
MAKRTGPAKPRAQARAPEPSSFPAHDEIARRAYELFVMRGRAEGLQLDDWLQAERELLDRAARRVIAPRRS